MCHSREICDSPFFNIFTVLHLGPFSHEETNELVDLPSANCNVPLTEYADHIREMAGCLPFNLQIACSVYFELLEHSDSVGLVNQSEVEN
ncbi:hypothetical protein H8D57_02200 [bacterium]|nr:hypothetical protein [bacterium]